MSTSRSVAVSGGMSWTRVRTPRWMARIAKVLFLAAGTAQLAVLLDLFWFGPLGAMAGAFAFFLFLASYIL